MNALRNPIAQSAPHAALSLLPPDLAGPWHWAQFGGPPMLVTQRSRRVVLLGMPLNLQHAVLTVHSPDTGHLVDLTPDHPLGRAFVAVPELLAHLAATQAAAAHHDACGCCQEGSACADAALLWEAEATTRQAAWERVGCPHGK